MNHDAALPTFRLEPGIALANAGSARDTPVSRESPAIEVLTDLSLVRAAVVHPATSLQQAEQMMILQGVRMLFVVANMPAIEGLITVTDLHGDRQMQVVHDRHLRFDELSVADVMSGLSSLDAIAYEDLRTATVGNLILTLQRFGRNHMLVVEAATAATPRRIRGLISRSQIERQLGAAIVITPVASTFSEIERALI